ncbi:MAG: AAA family ATPase [Acidimicrobiales bacterium]
MRVHRISLRSYRGVVSCELTFAERGVTVVEGDNEVGKSSAAEALHLIFDRPDDSTHRDVKAVRPLHRDAGAEVEVEVSAGPHRFVYAKRWHRDRYTRLKVLAPVPEALTGRDAHDRVRELLGQSVDLDLWRALSAPQADALSQRALGDHPSLVAALDTSTGGDAGAGEHSGLLERVEQEAARWWTPTDRPKAVLGDLRAAAAEARARVAASRQALEALEADIAWCADLERSAADLEPKHVAAVTAAAAAAANLDEVQRRCTAVDGLAVAARLAVSEATVAAGALADRAALADQVQVASTAVATATARCETATAAVAAAGEELTTELEAATTAHATLEEVEAAAASAAAASSRLRGLVTLRQAEARLAEAEHHRRALDEAVEELAANRSTVAAVADLQRAHEDVLRTEVALSAGQPVLRLEALQDVSVTVDGEAIPLSTGAVNERGVGSGLTIEVPGTLRITVAGGGDAQALEAAWQRATATFEGRCAALDVPDLAAAQALDAARRGSEAEERSRRAALDRIIRGTTVEELAALVSDARAMLDDASAAGAWPTTADVDAAAAAHDALCVRQRSAERAADQADAAVATARRHHASATAACTAAREHLVAAERALEGCARELVAARAARTDDELRLQAAEADEGAAAARATWQAARAQVAELDLEGAAQSAQRALTERDGLEGALRRVREDLAGIRSRLELQGEAGLQGRLADAESAAASADEELASVEARAAAAQLLHSTLSRHRDEAARAYGAPLRAEVESLGRRVFGEGFSVELDDDLRIAARLLDGVPVPWADLSVGAREQLAVLTRLAAATLVSADGGVPVVFDDVLGFCDPNRLALVASAFEAAAEHCQIIVLTCDPDRYRHLSRATTHCLTAPRAVEAREAG